MNMKPTFYLAGPSSLATGINARATDLIDIGYRWVGGWNWTKFDPGEHPPGDPKNRFLVMGDLQAAVACDLFVAFLHPEHLSLGTHMEIGARLGAGKEAHLVTNGMPWHLFYEHPFASQYTDWPAFLRRLDNEL